MFGFINLHKPPGPSSHTMVKTVRRMLDRKCKVGHGGTLDPFAEGVLVISIGGATRLERFLHSYSKDYIADITLGATSTTDDTEGEITTLSSDKIPTHEEIISVLGSFTGSISQKPPAFSAIKIGGKRAYKLARSGKAVVIPPRTVVIDSIKLLSYDWPTLRINVSCQSGTYIRSLARDIGEKLSVGGYCSRLIRTRVGPFCINNAADFDKIDLESNILDPLIVLDKLQKITISPSDQERLTHGNEIIFSTPISSSEVAFLDENDNLLAIGTPSDTRLSAQPSMVFRAR